MDKKRIPLNGTFELTGRCNLGCKMCLVRVDNKRIKELGFRERTAKEWIQMAEQARDAGTLGLLLTGGEVMLRPDFCEIYEAIARMGFLLTVYTNATMVTDKVMDLFRKYPPHKIGVTMYGASNETYEKLCGCSDGYDRFVEGIEKLATLPSVFDIRTTLVKDNYNDLQKMREMVRRKFGIEKTLHLSRFVCDSIRGGIAKPKECRISPEENISVIYKELVEFYQKAKQGKIAFPDVPAQKLKMQRYSLPNREYLFQHCGAGMDQYVISWDGRMYACGLLNKGYTEPFREGFQKAWELLPEQYPSFQTIKECETCQYAVLCEGCPAVRLAETGDWFGVPQYACQEAKNLYQILSEFGVFE